MQGTKNFLVNKHPLINQLRLTNSLRVKVYNRKSERRMGYTNALLASRQLWKGRHRARLQVRICSYERITSQNHTIALKVIISWKVGKGLVEIQHTGIIILVLTFSSQLILKDNIGTNEIHVRCIASIRFCPVEFNFTYPANNNGVSSYCALDTFGKLWLIQVSSIATYGNKRIP